MNFNITGWLSTTNILFIFSALLLLAEQGYFLSFVTNPSSQPITVEPPSIEELFPRNLALFHKFIERALTDLQESCGFFNGEDVFFHTLILSGSWHSYILFIGHFSAGFSFFVPFLFLPPDKPQMIRCLRRVGLFRMH
jgi:hypothetical protein